MSDNGIVCHQVYFPYFRVRTGPGNPGKSLNFKNKNQGLESPGILLKVLESPGIFLIMRKEIAKMVFARV